MTGRMILKRTLLIVPTSFNERRRFMPSCHSVFISLLLTTLLFCISCARTSSRAGDGASPLGYVALGDSTGIGLGARDGGGYVDRLFARIKQKRPGSTLINLSVAGATTADVINGQLPQLEGTRVPLVTICVGVNDLLSGREVKQFAENYETLVAKLKRTGSVIVIANLPDVASAPALRERADESVESVRLRLGQFNKVIEDIAARHVVPLVDLHKLSRDSAGSRPELFSSDGLHPSELGYAHWAEAMWAVVEPAIHE